MKKILGIMALGLLLSGIAYAKNNITKADFQNRIIKNGKTGFVLRYHKEKSPSKFEIILPKNSPSIISDYYSKYGVLGGSRSKPTKHGGIDFYIKVGSPILAAGNGKILVKEGDTVKRGQVVAEAGNQVKTNYGGGMEHLHFHISKKKVKAH